MRWLIILLIPILILSCAKKYDVVFNNDTDFMLRFVLNDHPVIASAHSVITIKSMKQGYYHWLLERVDGSDIASGEIGIYGSSDFTVWYDNGFEYSW